MPDGKIILEQHPPRTARVLGAALMSLLAVFFAYTTVAAVQAGLALGQSLSEAFVGALVNFLITLVHAGAALFLISMRARIILDPKIEEIQIVRDFRITQRTETHTFRDVVSVQIKEKSKHAKKKMQAHYLVNLLLKNRQVISLGNELNEAGARELSERLAKLLRVKVEEFPLLQAKTAVEK